VCLADYQAEDRLQQIPACGHTFHMDCIDHWLTTHTTCPLCRLSLLATKSSTEVPHVHDASIQQRPHTWEETQAIQISESSLGDARLPRNNSKDARNSDSFDHEREFTGSRYDTERHEPNDGFSGNFWFVAHELNCCHTF
jgi:E3 ubiquitin-protein ligase ATL7/58/59